MCSDVVLAMELVADNAIRRWDDLSVQVSALINTDCTPIQGIPSALLSCQGSTDVRSSIRHLAFFFGEHCSLPQTAQLTNCTCVVIKPHLVKARKVGKVIEQILGEGFEVSALQQFRINKVIADEFFEIYRVPSSNNRRT